MWTKQAIVAFAAAAAIAVLSSGGCGPGRPETVKVAGKITYQGKPVITGRITFQPEDGRRPASSVINPDGTYQLTTFESGDGAFLGKHKVTIKAVRLTGDAPAEDLGAKAGKLPSPNALPKLEWLVPEKYSRPDSSPLIAEVKPGSNVIDFDLP